MIYFDNAATSWPKPFSVITACRTGLTSLAANPGRGGYEMSLDTSQAIYDARKLAADFFGAERPEQVVFTQNCTHAINYALKGTLKEGDHVVVSDMEHNALMRPLHTLAERGTITYDVVTTGGSDEQTVSGFAKMIRRNTRMLVCLQASNLDGRILPIERLGQLAKRHRLLFLVDAAQSAGVVDIHMQRMNISLLTVSGHKGLYGPMGIGMLVVGGGVEIQSIIEGGTGSRSSDLSQPDFLPDLLECGTPNVPGILGLDAGIRFVSEMGPKYILAHEQELAALAAEGLGNMNRIRLYYHPKGVGVLSFDFTGTGSEKIAEELAKKEVAVRAGLHCAPAAHAAIGSSSGGLVRLSFGVFNDKEQVAEFLRIMKSMFIS